MEHLIATWIVGVWQRRRLGEHAPCWDPTGDHSPNTLFAAALAQGGFAMEIPASELYYQLLPAHYVTIHRQRGVKIRGLWYNGPALDPYRHEPSSGRGGRHKGRWVIRRDPRDARMVFFQDPGTHAWHTLRWTGLPPEGEVPSFNDARVRDLLSTARQAGLKPRTDAELLPLLLELIGAHIPVTAWPTMAKAARTEHAREAAQAGAAAADRATARPVHAVDDAGTPRPRPARARKPAQGNTEQRWATRARTSQQAVDADRRRRREEAVAAGPVSPPPRLGETFRRGSLFLLADTESSESSAQHPESAS
ncbi:MAG: Mu transposase C-terminal domain-containing protein [Pseudonocardia sp.]